MSHKTIAAISIALLSLGAALSAQAQTRATVVIQSGQPYYQGNQGNAPLVVQYGVPPPPRHEAIPRQQRGKVWVAGHWVGNGKRHVWQKGHWVKARNGYHYRESRWEERDGRWNMRPGGWDRDGDGVPNRHDQRPNNPNRY
ncbi:MAG: hypothetical protein K2Q97_16590 [Burkholderiaceae bacterium]|nr:hypothetical protein [Burkholderiaceae bacterium]